MGHFKTIMQWAILTLDGPFLVVYGPFNHAVFVVLLLASPSNRYLYPYHQASTQSYHHPNHVQHVGTTAFPIASRNAPGSLGCLTLGCLTLILFTLGCLTMSLLNPGLLNSEFAYPSALDKVQLGQL